MCTAKFYFSFRSTHNTTKNIFIQTEERNSAAFDCFSDPIDSIPPSPTLRRTYFLQKDGWHNVAFDFIDCDEYLVIHSLKWYTYHNSKMILLTFLYIIRYILRIRLSYSWNRICLQIRIWENQNASRPP